MRRASVLVALFLIPSAAQAQVPERVRRVEAELPGVVAERMVHGNLPGVCVVLVADGKVVYARGFGRNNLAYPDPVTPDSVFRVASLTKQFTALAALLLEEDGKLKLDDPVVKLVPGFKTHDGKQDAITLRHLLSHHSGLPRGPYYGARHPDVSGQVKDLAGMDLVHAPGTTFKYSNCGYVLAGLVVEKAAGMPYREFVKRRILDPLGLTKSGFELSDPLASRYATGYQTDHYRSLVVPGDRLHAAPLYPAPDAAGNLYAAGTDVARFLLFLLGKGQLDSARLLPPGRFAEMVRPFKPGKLGDDGAIGYALGLGISRRLGRRCFSHAGAYYGHSAAMVGFPEEGIGGVVLINRAAAHHENNRILDHALALLLGEKPPPAPAGDAALAGVYRDGEHKVEVVAHGTDLYLVDSGLTHRLEPFGSASYLAGAGRFKGWPVDFSVKDLLRAGPFELTRGEVPAAADSSPVDRFCGTYRADDFGEVVVFRRGKELIFAFNRAEQVRLEPVAENRFRIAGGSCDGEPAEFRVEKGRVTSLRAGYMNFQRGPF
jgi:CubicO group peptidase (beta-lactamase class C family)